MLASIRIRSRRIDAARREPWQPSAPREGKTAMQDEPRRWWHGAQPRGSDRTSIEDNVRNGGRPRRPEGARIRRALLLQLVTVALAHPCAAAVIEVTTTSDSSGGSDCSLRDAIVAANSDFPSRACDAGSGPDTIDLSGLEGSVTLTAALPRIKGDLHIRGPGASRLRLSGDQRFRVLTLRSGGLEIEGLTITGGRAAGGDGGGCEAPPEDPTACYGPGYDVFGGGGAAGLGGGLLVIAGSVTLRDVVLEGNQAIGGRGGGSVDCFARCRTGSGYGGGGVGGDAKGGDGGPGTPFLGPAGRQVQPGAGACGIPGEPPIPATPSGRGGGGGGSYHQCTVNGECCFGLPGGDGGFGGGGGGGSGDGGFGGGGGAGGGVGGFGGGDGGKRGGGGGAGLGGAVFVRGGRIRLAGVVEFRNNLAEGGSTQRDGERGLGKGGGLFVLRTRPVTIACGAQVSFVENVAADAVGPSVLEEFSDGPDWYGTLRTEPCPPSA